MKNLRNILIALAFVGLSAGAVNAQTSGSCGATLNWELTGTGDNLTLTISGTGAMTNYSWNIDVPWYSQCENIKTLVLPNGMTTIGNYAFYHCSGLTSVTIPNSVTTIGSVAFEYCSGLTSVTIPNSVTTIGDGAFSGCSGLTSIDVGASNTQYSSIDGVLFNKLATILIQYPAGKQGSYIIPNSVTTIKSSAFAGCSGLTSITIPNSITIIENYAFAGCSGLTSVTIPNSVTIIEYSAFYGCSGLNNVYVSWTTPPVININVFEGLTLSNITLHVPCGSYSLYAVAAVWQYFNIVELSITATAGSNGSISPSGITNASCGENKTFTFTPNTGYEIDVVLIDDVPNATAKENGYHTFENVTTNHTISVTFKATVGIDDIVETDNYPSLRIYPNPTQDKLTIAGGDLQINCVEICDLAGRIVGAGLAPAQSGQPQGSPLQIDISHLPAGIYLIKIHTEKGIITRKAVKN